MPQPIILKDTSGLAEGIEQFGSALSGALAQRNEKQRQLHQLGSIGNAFGSVDETKPIGEQLSAFNTALQRAGIPVSPDTALRYFQVMQKSQAESKKNRLKMADIEGISEIGKALGPDATFGEWANALAMSGIDPSVSEKFLLNKYRSELLKTREGESEASTKRLTREERNQKIKLLESDYKETLKDLKDDMQAAKQEYRSEDVKRISKEIQRIQKQRIEDRKRIVKGLEPLLHGDKKENEDEAGGDDELNAILFG